MGKGKGRTIGMVSVGQVVVVVVGVGVGLDGGGGAVAGDGLLGGGEGPGEGRGEEEVVEDDGPLRPLLHPQPAPLLMAPGLAHMPGVLRQLVEGILPVLPPIQDTFNSMWRQNERMDLTRCPRRGAGRHGPLAGRWRMTRSLSNRPAHPQASPHLLRHSPLT